jgi:hypothetical protein
MQALVSDVVAGLQRVEQTLESSPDVRQELEGMLRSCCQQQDHMSESRMQGISLKLDAIPGLTKGIIGDVLCKLEQQKTGVRWGRVVSFNLNLYLHIYYSLNSGFFGI